MKELEGDRWLKEQLKKPNLSGFSDELIEKIDRATAELLNDLDRQNRFLDIMIKEMEKKYDKNTDNRH